MKLTGISASVIFLLILAACGKPNNIATVQPEPVEDVGLFKDARAGFETTLVRRGDHVGAPDRPVARLFRLIKYPAQSGPHSAYLTPDPANGKKNPAIIWITGGDCNSIGNVWDEAGPSNDQTASAYRKAGLIMMFPSLRGGNDNPGRREGFLGEVDDVLSALDYLEGLPFVDADRIYLGGHSTGGTLALLVSEASDRFRAVFSFGPVASALDYGRDFVFYDLKKSNEVNLRKPIRWLASVQSPTFVLEGASGSSNADSIRIMRAKNNNPAVHFYEVAGTNHFSVLYPVNKLIAQKILKDTGKTTNIEITEAELSNIGAG